MSNHDVTDPISAVDGVQRKSPLKAAGPEQAPSASGSNQGSSKSGFLFETNYVLEVMKYTNIAMEHQANIVAMRGELAALGTKIASDMATISEFISKIQSEAHSGGTLINGYIHGAAGSGAYSSPESYSGLANDFYQIDEQGNIGSDNGTGDVSSSYQASMQNFIAAVKDLFYCSPTGTGPTVGELSTIDNPTDPSKNFDMLSYYAKISDPKDPLSFAQYAKAGFNVVSSDPSMHASLLQQYMYAKAKLTVNTTPSDQVAAANGDIGKLVSFNPDPSNPDGTMDSDLMPFLQVLTDLNAPVQVNTDHGNDYHSWLKSTSGNILDMIMEGKLYNSYTDAQGNTTTDLNYNPAQVGKEDVGLYGAFAYMAYDYIWTKNPNLDVADQAASNVNKTPGAVPSGWRYEQYKGALTEDPLSGLSGNITSAQTNFNSATSATGTSFQQDVNSVQQVDGAAGKIIDGFSQGQETSVRNFKGS